MRDLTTAVAGQHVRSLRTEQRRAGLQHLADCCRPSVLRRAGAAYLAWLRKGQLGPGYTCC